MATQTKTSNTVTDQPSTSWYHGFTQAATAKYWAAIARIAMGFVYLWAFLDKTFGLTYATPSDGAWMFATGDGSPTFGYLTFGVNPEGQLAGFFHSLGESAGVMGAAGPTLYPGSWVNWAFMLGLLGAGVTLILGVFMRIGSIGAAALLMMMYVASAPWAQFTDDAGVNQSNNPIADDHLAYAIFVILLMLLTAERTWGLGKWWQSLGFVQKHPWLA